jgi:hypothetical protein
MDAIWWLVLQNPALSAVDRAFLHLAKGETAAAEVILSCEVEDGADGMDRVYALDDPAVFRLCGRPLDIISTVRCGAAAIMRSLPTYVDFREVIKLSTYAARRGDLHKYCIMPAADDWLERLAAMEDNLALTKDVLETLVTRMPGFRERYLQSKSELARLWETGVLTRSTTGVVKYAISLWGAPEIGGRDEAHSDRIFRAYVFAESPPELFEELERTFDLSENVFAYCSPPRYKMAFKAGMLRKIHDKVPIDTGDLVHIAIGAVKVGDTEVFDLAISLLAEAGRTRPNVEIVVAMLGSTHDGFADRFATYAPRFKLQESHICDAIASGRRDTFLLVWDAHKHIIKRSENRGGDWQVRDDVDRVIESALTANNIDNAKDVVAHYSFTGSEDIAERIEQSISSLDLQMKDDMFIWMYDTGLLWFDPSVCLGLAVSLRSERATQHILEGTNADVLIAEAMRLPDEEWVAHTIAWRYRGTDIPIPSGVLEYMMEYHENGWDADEEVFALRHDIMGPLHYGDNFMEHVAKYGEMDSCPAFLIFRPEADRHLFAAHLSRANRLTTKMLMEICNTPELIEEYDGYWNMAYDFAHLNTVYW